MIWGVHNKLCKSSYKPFWIFCMVFGKGYANFLYWNLDISRILFTHKGLVFEIDILYEVKSYLTLTWHVKGVLHILDSSSFFFHHHHHLLQQHRYTTTHHHFLFIECFSIYVMVLNRLSSEIYLRQMNLYTWWERIICVST